MAETQDFDSWASSVTSTPAAPAASSAASGQSSAVPEAATPAASSQSFEDFAKNNAPPAQAEQPQPPEQPGYASIMYHATGNLLDAFGSAVSSNAMQYAESKLQQGEIPSIFGAAKDAGKLELEGVRTGIEGIQRAEAAILTPYIEKVGREGD